MNKSMSRNINILFAIIITTLAIISIAILIEPTFSKEIPRPTLRNIEDSSLDLGLIDISTTFITKSLTVNNPIQVFGNVYPATTMNISEEEWKDYPHEIYLIFPGSFSYDLLVPNEISRDPGVITLKKSPKDFKYFGNSTIIYTSENSYGFTISDKIFQKIKTSYKTTWIYQPDINKSIYPNSEFHISSSDQNVSNSYTISFALLGIIAGMIFWTVKKESAFKIIKDYFQSQQGKDILYLSIMALSLFILILFFNQMNEVGPDPTFLEFSWEVMPLGEIIKNMPNNTSALNNYANELINKGNYTGGLEYYNRALKIEPNNLNILFNKSLLLKELQDYDSANTELEKILKYDPTHLQALVEKSITLDQFGNHTGAMYYINEAEKLYPENYNVIANKAATLVYNGLFTNASEYTQRALEMNPNSTQLRNIEKFLNDNMSSMQNENSKK